MQVIMQIAYARNNDPICIRPIGDLHRQIFTILSYYV